MGSSHSSSKSSQTITNNVVNSNYLNTLNKTIMESAVNTMINNASSCSSAVNVNNSCDMSGTNVAGNLNFGGNQSGQAKVNFNCIQANQTSANMATAMMDSMVAEMKALNGTEAASQLNTASQSSNKSDFLSSFGTSSSSNSNVNVNNNITNQTISNVENIFEQKLNNNFTVNTVNECIGKTKISNSQDLSNMNIGGNANVECIQTASVEQVSNCKQLSDAIQKTTQETFQELGMKVDTKSTTANSTESTVSSKSENVSTGLYQGIADVLNSIFGALGLEPYILPICACCCVLLLLLSVFAAFIAFSNGSGSGSDSGSDFGSGISSDGGKSLENIMHHGKKTAKNFIDKMRHSIPHGIHSMY
jgi:hypothetical protein